MKLIVLVSAVTQTFARLQGANQGVIVKLHPDDGTVHYGDSSCPCIGFDNIAGETDVEFEDEQGESVMVSYPADVGARCEMWDNNRNPQCKKGTKPGLDEGYCGQEWCYVDPCNCQIDVLPKMTTMLTQASYRGKPLFFSYATCGGKDMFSQKRPPLGNPKCRCIGFAGVSGTTEITFKDGRNAEFPADLGSSCQTWDLDAHPDCKVENPPSWCTSNWCYVDPCECSLPGDTVPKISAYLPDAAFTGKGLYYSYETCGSEDTWTEKYHPDACVNQLTKDLCLKHNRCSWTGKRCLGWELVNHPLCKATFKELMEAKAKNGEHSSAPHGHSSMIAMGVALATALRRAF